MARIEWTGQRTTDPDFNPVHEVKVDGKRLGVRVSTEAMQDHGEAAVRAIAEKKIRALLDAGSELKGITVTNADFR